MSIKNWPENERPRERLLNQGANALSDAELLAIFLRTGTTKQSAIDLARSLIQAFGGLANLLAAPKQQVLNIHGIGTAKYAHLMAALELGKRYLESQIKTAPTLGNSGMVKDYLTTQLRSHANEMFAVLFLDSQLAFLHFEVIFTGSITSCPVTIKEVLRQTLAHHAVNIVIAHNHPNSTPTPSQADLQLTQQLKQACTLLDVTLVDHVIVGQNSTASFAEQGML